jgi:hypothetical protein
MHQNKRRFIKTHARLTQQKLHKHDAPIDYICSNEKNDLPLHVGMFKLENAHLLGKQDAQIYNIAHLVRTQPQSKNKIYSETSCMSISSLY